MKPAAWLGTLTEACEPHRCAMPTVTHHFTMPAEDDDPALEMAYEDIPRLGSVYECHCGATWEVVPPKRYANLVVCINQWKQVSRRRYRRAVRKMRA